MSEYQVIVKSKLYGRESFTYDSFEEAFNGLQRLILRGMELKDAVVRWYRIKEKKSSDNDPSTMEEMIDA